jgi:MHS family proline/betaine transporter-like MFS transporter
MMVAEAHSGTDESKPSHPLRGRQGRRSTLAGAVGNVIEWYDFSLYGFFAPVLARLFFPQQSETAALLATFGVFAAGFLMRPLGAVIFGQIGDRYGRRRVLVWSVAMMALPTLALGLLPTFAQVGVLAPLLLVAVRLFQGLSVGGEFTGSVTYMVETAPPGRRGLAGSWANVGGNVGMLLGVGVAALMTTSLSDAALDSWGWRLPFIVGGALGMVSILLPLSLSESELFQHDLFHAGDSPLRQALTNDRSTTLRALVFACGYGVAFYLPLVYLPTYAARFADISLGAALRANTIALAILTVLVPVTAIVSDRWIRRRTVLVIAFVAVAALAIPAFELVRGGGFGEALLGQVLFAVLLALPLGVAPAMLAEQFPTADRETAYSLAYNVGFGVAGGTAPLIATWLIAAVGAQLAPAGYLVALALVAALAATAMPDRSRDDLL